MEAQIACNIEARICRLTRSLTVTGKLPIKLNESCGIKRRANGLGYIL